VCTRSDNNAILNQIVLDLDQRRMAVVDFFPWIFASTIVNASVGPG
jgi:hypothetical protein